MESGDMMAKNDKQDLTEIKVVRKTVRKKEEPKKPTKQKPNDDERILSDLRDRQHTYQQSVIHNPDRFSFIKDEPKRTKVIRWYRSYLEKRYALTNKLSPIRFLPTALQVKWYGIDPQHRHRLLKGLLIAIVILLMGIGIYNNSQQERIEAEREQEERLLREQEIEEIREQTRQEAEERLEEQRQREQENKDRVDELQEELERLETEELHRERQEEIREEIRLREERMEEREQSDNQLEHDRQRRLDEIKRLKEQERNNQESNDQESNEQESNEQESNEQESNEQESNEQESNDQESNAVE